MRAHIKYLLNVLIVGLILMPTLGAYIIYILMCFFKYTRYIKNMPTLCL